MDKKMGGLLPLLKHSLLLTDWPCRGRIALVQELEESWKEQNSVKAAVTA